MCDPLSVGVSALTIAEVAAKTCEGLYKILRRFSEAPRDIEHHINSLRTLQSTFVAITGLEQHAEGIPLITPDFKARLRECMLDLQAMERLANSFDVQLEEGRIRRTWARLRWASADQRQLLKSHLGRIESYHRIFSLDLLLCNM